MGGVTYGPILMFSWSYYDLILVFNCFILCQMGSFCIQIHWHLSINRLWKNPACYVNLIIFSPDETRIYVADTGGDKGNPDAKTHDLAPGIHCFEVNTDGRLGKKIFRTNKGSDGMK